MNLVAASPLAGAAYRVRHEPTEIDAVVLAGTYSRAWRPELPPRPTVPVANVPLVVHVLSWLAAAGVRRATMCANGSTDALRRLLRTGAQPPLPEVRYYSDSMPRGAAGCVRDAAPPGGHRPVLVVDGAAIPTIDLDEVLAAHARSGAALTVVTQASPDGRRDRPLEPAGIYVCDPRALEFVPRAGYHDIKEELVPRLHAAGEPIQIYAAPNAFPHVLNLQTYFAANGWVLEQEIASAADARWREYERVGDMLVHRTARVHATAFAIGPVLIGAGADVEPGAVLVGPTVVGDRSVLRAGSVVSRSVAWRDCVVGAEAMIDVSLLCDGVHVAAGETLRQAVRLASGHA